MPKGHVDAAGRPEKGEIVLSRDSPRPPPFLSRCIQRIRFDLRLLSRVTFVVAFAAARELRENSGMKLALDRRWGGPRCGNKERVPSRRGRGGGTGRLTGNDKFLGFEPANEWLPSSFPSNARGGDSEFSLYANSRGWVWIMGDSLN